MNARQDQILQDERKARKDDLTPVMDVLWRGLQDLDRLGRRHPSKKKKEKLALILGWKNTYSQLADWEAKVAYALKSAIILWSLCEFDRQRKIRIWTLLKVLSQRNGVHS